MSNPIDFVDHAFPAIGAIFSIRNDRVIMHYKIARYSLQGPTEVIWMQIITKNEEMADKVAEEVGEILEKKHFWQLLQEAEDIALGKGELPLISGDNIKT